MTTLAETYLRLDIRLSEPDLRELRAYLRHSAPTFAEGLFRQVPEFTIQVEDGSVRAWLAAVGFLYVGISGYGSFRSGLDYAVKDARTFSERVLQEVENSGVSETEIPRFERRLGVPGKLQRIFRRLDRLEKSGRNLSKADYEREIQSINRGLHNIFREVDNKRDHELILQSLPKQFKSKLPKRLPVPGPRESPMVRLRRDEMDLPTYHLSQLHRVDDDEVARKRREEEKLYRFRSFDSGFRLILKE